MKTDILFIPNNIGLCHTMRSYIVAKELKKRGYDVKFAYTGKRSDFIDKDMHVPGTYVDYDESFLLAPRTALEYLFDKNILRNIVKSEIELIESVGPKLIVGDTRFTLKITAKTLKRPFITMLNANLTPLYEIMPEQYRQMHKSYVVHYNDLLGEVSDDRVDSFYDVCIADMNIFCDLREYFPIFNPPKGYEYAGPIFWEFDGNNEFVEEIENLWSKGKRFVYVTMGGTGNPDVSEQIMSSIEKTGRDTIISSGQWIDLSKINRKVHKSDFIPPKIMQFCDTVISHAGNGTTYSALKYGTPTLGLPYNPDQVDNARSIERLGVGIIFYEYYDKPVDMSGSIERLSSNNDFKNNIKPLSRNVRKSEGRIRAADLIESYLRNKI